MGTSTLFCFGLGYTGVRLAREALASGWHVAGTCRSDEKAQLLQASDIQAVVFDGENASREISEALQKSDFLLSSVPPDDVGDPVINRFSTDIESSSRLRWLGYLSSTGVYGDRDGEWVDETSEPRPQTEDNKRRLETEKQWLSLGKMVSRPTSIFRLPGIYGPDGRNNFESLKAGNSRRIIKPGQIFNRAHVDDIVAVLMASMTREESSGVFNIADDEPAPADEVLSFAASLLNIEPPPAVNYEDAGLPPFAKHFYEESRRVSNQRIKQELGVTLKYPTYREGLNACLDCQ